MLAHVEALHCTHLYWEHLQLFANPREIIQWHDIFLEKYFGHSGKHITESVLFLLIIHSLKITTPIIQCESYFSQTLKRSPGTSRGVSAAAASPVVYADEWTVIGLCCQHGTLANAYAKRFKKWVCLQECRLVPSDVHASRGAEFYFKSTISAAYPSEDTSPARAVLGLRARSGRSSVIEIFVKHRV